MTKILITGANGQLGSELKDIAVKNPQFEYLFTDVQELDIANQEQVLAYMALHKPQFIVNCAAYTAVDRAEGDEAVAHIINAKAPAFLAEGARTINAKFIHISTDYVFDGKNFAPYTEDVKTNPTSVYGRTKLEGELFSLKAYTETIIIRTSWLYSVYGNNFVKTMMKLGRERDSLGVIFDQVGTPTNAKDLAGAIFSIITQSSKEPSAFVPGIYHYSNEGVCSWYDFAIQIHEYAGITCAVKPLLSKEYPTAAPRPHYSVLDKSKIKKTFQITIPYWKNSLLECINSLTLQN